MTKPRESMSNPFVSRGGLKLAAALDALALDVRGYRCVDLGANVGGFTDCLLRREAEQVVAVDTAYGVLEWKLRTDPRVVVVERTNALHADPGAILGEAQAVDLVTVDLGWTPQAHAVPAALRWGPQWILTLIKPHYEASHGRRGPSRGRLEEGEAARLLDRVLGRMPDLGVEPVGSVRSPVAGGKKRRSGNVEYLALLRPRRP